ncbi:hypothetical protein [Fructilactobacillus fructivorans]|uniref:hypothetical protein n=1 Tax=Fructilactobacillus fructivorans TaxID=1614 RepID=UPI000704C59E|nr:hypothetical protein [Fructilactobacillus fructivorans]
MKTIRKLISKQKLVDTIIVTFIVSMVMSFMPMLLVGIFPILRSNLLLIVSMFVGTGIGFICLALIAIELAY